MDNIIILIFGVGELQRSIIERAKLKGYSVVGIDPNENAVCKSIVDYFEVVSAHDLEKTLAIALKYQVSAVITAATDKPLIMMAKVAERLNLPFFSIETAIKSTDKYLMKECFIKNGILCACGKKYSNLEDFLIDKITYPVIIKPRDNSGSRGVFFCNSFDELLKVYDEVMLFTSMPDVLIEQYIDGREYSVECVHHNNRNEIVQITEKTTSNFPYNVELSHIQPAYLSLDQKDKIRELIDKVSNAMCFVNCASHTEIKINSNGIFVIETSPRLGGDYITSHLVPLSTGVSIEDILIDISLGKKVNDLSLDSRSSMVLFFNLTPHKIVDFKDELLNFIESNDVNSYSFRLNNGDEIPIIKNSLDRYGELVLSDTSRTKLEKRRANIESFLKKYN